MTDAVKRFERARKTKLYLTVASIAGFFAFVSYWSSVSDHFEIAKTIPATFHGSKVKIYEVEPGDLEFSEDVSHLNFQIQDRKVSFRHEGETEWRECELVKALILPHDTIICFVSDPSNSIDPRRFRISLLKNNVFSISELFDQAGSDEPVSTLLGYYQDPRRTL